MEELRGGYKAHFWLALVFAGAGALCVGSTWLPGGQAPPKWLEAALCLAAFPVFAVALIRGLITGVAAELKDTRSFGAYVLLLPHLLKLTYVLFGLLAVLGLVTGFGAAEDAQADASGYYYTYWDKSVDPQRSVRAELTESEYHDAMTSQFRIFVSGSVLFYAYSSFLVLASASAAADRARSAVAPPARLPG
ncbi:hypothetical protein AB0467_06205 [Streptomyces sp. NPDC052095]|uniref:hypothetical protein n=1 Tax=unclassified Streptomyces TaxID=2593676 RepID=UPI00344C9DB2